MSRRAARAARIATGEQPILADAPLDKVMVVQPVEPVLIAALRTPVVEAPAEPVRVAPVFEPPTFDAPTTEAPTFGTPTQPFELIEPEVDREPVVEDAPVEEPRVAASFSDDFEAAARLFSFTGQTPIHTPAGSEDAQPEAAEPATPHVAARGSRATRGAAFRRVATASFSVGVMGIVGLLTVGMTTPAEAVAAVGGSGVNPLAATSIVADSPAAIDEDEIQAYVAPAEIENVQIDRDENYETMSMAEFASELGIKDTSNLFVNDPNSNIQWPFAVGVPMSSGFGPRWGRMHEGVDFVPGYNSPIQAIADGTVRIAQNGGDAYGVQVVIDHIIDGKRVSSRYAHMIYGSIEVKIGQQVKVGQILGHTGNTGRSTGAHTHFEILLNGTTAVDPLPWMREHADGTHSVG